jgi:predicted glycoside hydrolase/deacetylase ChbG (UPF0249 family)
MSQMKKTKKQAVYSNISIVIPIYNEADLLKKAIPDFIKYAEKTYPGSEIILVENGSSDGSREAVDELAKRFNTVRALHLPKPFYGAALRAGLLTASKPSVIKLDADWLNIEFMEGSLPLLKDFAIVAGSKSLRPELDKRPWMRKIGSKLLTSVLNRFFGYTGGDSRGLKAFRRKEMLELLEQSVSDEIIESEMMLRAFRMGMPATEIPVAIEEVRAPRISFFRRCGMVARELLKLYGAIKATKDTKKSELHADDAGLNPKSNAAIENLIKKGYLQSTSLMVNTPYSAEAAKMLSKYPEVVVFMHFNLTTGRSVATPQAIPSLVNKDGEFRSAKGKFVLNCATGRVKKADVAAEFEAQWSKLESFGIKIQGIDTEQHTHSLEPVASIVEAATQKNGVKMIRNYNRMKTQTIKGTIKFRLLMLLARLTSLRYNRNFQLPVSWQGDSWKSYVVASWEPLNLSRLSNETIVIHPGGAFDHELKPTPQWQK